MSDLSEMTEKEKVEFAKKEIKADPMMLVLGVVMESKMAFAKKIDKLIEAAEVNGEESISIKAIKDADREAFKEEMSKEDGFMKRMLKD